MTLASAVARPSRLEPAILALACVGLAARPLTDASVLATVAIGVVGVVAARRVIGDDAFRSVVIAMAGCAAFAIATGFGSTPPPRAGAFVIAGAIAAGIGEEALLRGALYERLERAGVAVAIALPAVIFALVHVPRYGPAVLPLDLAAGVLFGWQRWASGGWAAPAATHVVANMLVLA